MSSYNLREKVDHIGYITPEIDSVYSLPTIKQTLAVFFYKIRKLSMSVDESAKDTIKQCLDYWKNARMPTQEEHKCIAKLKFEYSRWTKIRKNSSRKSDIQKKNEEAYENSLNLLFDIASANAFEIIDNESDKKFLRHEKGKLHHFNFFIFENLMAKLNRFHYRFF